MSTPAHSPVPVGALLSLRLNQGNYEEEAPAKTSATDLPLSRVKKIMTADPDVSKIQKKAVVATVRV